MSSFLLALMDCWVAFVIKRGVIHGMITVSVIIP